MQLTVNEHVDIIGIIERESCITGTRYPGTVDLVPCCLMRLCLGQRCTKRPGDEQRAAENKNRTTADDDIISHTASMSSFVIARFTYQYHRKFATDI